MNGLHLIFNESILGHSSFAVFAQAGFANWGMLGWAAVAGLPVLIHLLHRRRYKVTDWAAMQFLLQATRKHSRRIRLEQLLLLAIRVLILLLLVTALARPYMSALGSFFQSDAPTHRIVVVDTSMSLAHQSSEQSRFEQARELAREVISSSRQGDALNLVRMGTLPPTVLVQKPSYQKSQVLSEVDNLRQTHEVADVVTSLRDVETLLAEASAITQKEVVFISDFQQTSWQPEASGRQSQVGRTLKRLSEQARVFFLPVGQPDAANLAISSFSIVDPYVTTGRPANFRVTVSNHSLNSSGSRSVQLVVNDRVVASEQVDIAADDSATVDFETTFASAGEFRVEARFANEDALSVDDHRFLAVPVKEKLNVLLVNGRPAGRPRETATFYLQQVLQSSPETAIGMNATATQVIGDGELAAVDLSRYDCVFLCDVALITEQEATLLSRFVEAGGGLVICLGDRVQAANYNQTLFADGQGLLPAKLLETAGGTAEDDLDAIFQFDPIELKHPIVNAYLGNPGTGLEDTIVFKYFRTSIEDGMQVERVLNFTNGDAALLDRKVGWGRVILITTSVDDRWGLWPVQPNTSFPPIISETVRYVVAGRWAERNRQVGEPLTLTGYRSDRSAIVVAPDQTEATLQASSSENALQWDNTSLSGFYEFRIASTDRGAGWFAVNPDPSESQLHTVSKSTFEQELLPGAKFSYQPTWKEAPRVSQADDDGNGLIRWLLRAVLCLIFVEQLMAWRFGWGLVALLACIVCTVVRQAVFGPLAWGTAFGLVAILIILRVTMRSGKTGSVTSN
ncbi:BatA domain-containing protein [Thalassoroseus pseudoceratinae]|uniref:BatA domain-containing protein n=1 Tax=Thalassoroseus pseudoceratinae TaxID=2713176 RepID=UPI001422289E|nr:BatA domain-containing protein [Thalassoroseus pseudoceratinae]